MQEFWIQNQNMLPGISLTLITRSLTLATSILCDSWTFSKNIMMNIWNGFTKRATISSNGTPLFLGFRIPVIGLPAQGRIDQDIFQFLLHCKAGFHRLFCILGHMPVKLRHFIDCLVGIRISFFLCLSVGRNIFNGPTVFLFHFVPFQNTLFILRFRVLLYMAHHLSGRKCRRTRLYGIHPGKPSRTFPRRFSAEHTFPDHAWKKPVHTVCPAAAQAYRYSFVFLGSRRPETIKCLSSPSRPKNEKSES